MAVNFSPVFLLPPETKVVNFPTTDTTKRAVTPTGVAVPHSVVELTYSDLSTAVSTDVSIFLNSASTSYLLAKITGLSIGTAEKQRYNLLTELPGVDLNDPKYFLGANEYLEVQLSSVASAKNIRSTIGRFES